MCMQISFDFLSSKFLIQVLFQVLDVHAYESRQKDYASKGHKHFYFMTLDGSEVCWSSSSPFNNISFIIYKLICFNQH